MFSKVWNSAVTALPVVALAASGLTFAPKAAKAQTTAPTIGQCLAPTILQGGLRSEEQKFVINAVEKGIFKNSKQVVTAFTTGIDFTATPDGKTGYIIQACRNDFGKATGEIKAQKKLSDVRVYPETLSAPLPEMFVKTTDEQAAKGCATWDVGSCGAHNNFLKTAYKNGYRVVLQGYDASDNTIFSISKKGQESALIATDAATGASTVMSTMVNTEFSKFAKDMGYAIPVNAAAISNGRPVAALTPSRALN